MELPILKQFAFNPFQENTYILISQTKECVIIDPGNSDSAENKVLSDYIALHDLQPKAVWLTHAHIDHIMGTAYVYDRYKLVPKIHADELYVFNAGKVVADNYGLNYSEGPLPEISFKDGDSFYFNEYKVECIWSPGHSPGSIAFYFPEQKLILSGDVLFLQSIGRTDLPGGDHNTLLRSIKDKLYTLPNDVSVYSGHGPKTTIGYEKQHNGFVRGE